MGFHFIRQACRITIYSLYLLLPLQAEAAPGLDYHGLLELQAVHSDASRSWFNGGYGKYAYDRDSAVLQPGKAGLNLDIYLTDTLWLRSLTVLNTEPKVKPALIESYLHYRPVPRGMTRWRLKAGAFYAPLSLENGDTGWSSRYTSTPSMINTWVGEELRSVGAELELEWPGRFRQSAHGYSLVFGVFGFNDPTGAALASRGWAQHDRQTSLFGEFHAPEGAGGPEEIYPFGEVDDRPGYYIGGIWRYQRRYEFRVFHYDNRADPTARRNERNAWNTEFRQFAVDLELPAGFELLGQYMIGDTYVENPMLPMHIYTDFAAGYAMLSKEYKKHRFSVRYERFDIDNRGSVPNLLNEDGHSWTLSWVYEPGEKWWLNLEWMMTDTGGFGRQDMTLFNDSDGQVLMSIRRYF